LQNDLNFETPQNQEEVDYNINTGKQYELFKNFLFYSPQACSLSVNNQHVDIVVLGIFHSYYAEMFRDN
jgi:hypothetical protein